MEVMTPNETNFRLAGAILFYQCKSGYSCSSSGQKAAAIFHFAREDGSLAPGRALDMKALEYFFRNSNGADQLKFQDSKILARSCNSIVWYEKSRRAPIYFQIDRKKRTRAGDSEQTFRSNGRMAAALVRDYERNPVLPRLEEQPPPDAENETLHRAPDTHQ